MALKIEKVAIQGRASASDWHEFLSAIKVINIGESFVIAKKSSQHDVVLGAAPILLDKRFACGREKNGSVRVGRTA